MAVLRRTYVDRYEAGEAFGALLGEADAEVERLRTWQKAYAKGRAGLVEQADQDFARANEAEATVTRLREAVEWAQLRGVAMNDAGLVVRMNYALNPQEADHE